MKKPLAGTITVRLPTRSLRLLKADARKRQKTPSELIRELIEKQYEPWPAGLSAWDLSKQWVGAVHSDEIAPGSKARETLSDWNPDRR